MRRKAIKTFFCSEFSESNRNNLLVNVHSIVKYFSVRVSFDSFDDGGNDDETSNRSESQVNVFMHLNNDSFMLFFFFPFRQMNVLTSSFSF